MADFSKKAQPRPEPGSSVGPLLPPALKQAEGPARRPFPEIPGQLWLCVYLPQLPLEAVAGQSDPDQPDRSQKTPLAICAEEGRRTLIISANALATARGVRSGMPLNSALALAPDLVVERRNPALETTALARLADWAGRFTPAVTISPGNALLLEVQGSLRLFNGLEALQAALAGGLRALGYQARMACAPTARAALWLARAGVGHPARTGAELRQLLAGVHVACLGWPARTVQTLLQMGLTTVGDCVRLPREGFARRLGPGRLRELDQAFGRHPDPQRAHVAPTRFLAELELPAETTDASLLLEGFQQLLQCLRQALVSRQASISSVWCRLTHPDRQETRLRLGLPPAAGFAMGHATGEDPLSGLLRLRLEALALPAPVASLALQADLEPGQAPVGRDLLGQDLRPDGGLRILLERLRARLGGQAVQGFALRVEHRPESAWQPVPDPLAGTGATSEPRMVRRSRPVWLLPAPELLGLIAGQPAWRGVLSFECGPERIESGWWDGGDVRRDYYRASNPEGAMLWVYRDLRSRAWYLQGLFG